MIKIDFHYHSKDVYQIMVYQRYQEAFRARGFECRFFPDAFPDSDSQADLFVVQERFVGSLPEKLGRPIVVEERQDSSMPIAKDVVALENVVRFFKPSVVRPEYMNVRAERLHLWFLDQQTAEATYPQRRRNLTEEEIAKVQPGFHLGLLNELEPWVQRARDPDAQPDWQNRPIDALFIGTTSYGLPTLDRHRLQFCDVLRAIRGLNIVCVPNRSMSRRDYLNMVFQSKIIVSPWGYGEVCYRDFEAILAGCVLIKPRTDFVRTVDNILASGGTYLPCEIDASDLEEKIRMALVDKMYASGERQNHNRDRVLEWWNEDRLVNWWRQEITLGLAGKWTILRDTRTSAGFD